jgi:hypothetical protein
MTGASWTEMPHWTVIAKDRGGSEECIAHYLRHADAVAHAARARKKCDRAWVDVTVGNTPKQACETEAMG